MKKYFAILLLLLFAPAVSAQDKIKIGFIDIQRAISESQSGKKAREKFQAEVKKAEGGLLK
ncbi:MAG: OmpH family outer membrane protein, partial [Candidatus Binatia bacterium]